MSPEFFEFFTLYLDRSALAALSAGGYERIRVALHKDRQRIVALCKLANPDIDPLICTAILRGWSINETRRRMRQKRVDALLKEADRQAGPHRDSLLAEARRVNGGPVQHQLQTQRRRRAR